MTISPTILIIAAIVIIMLIVVAVREIRGLSNENETLTRQIVAYMRAFGEVDSDAQAIAKKIDDELGAPKNYILTKEVMDEAIKDPEVKSAYEDTIGKRGKHKVEINPRTGQPYKTTKAQREASKKWNANHPERNSTEGSKESRRKYVSSHAEEHKGKYAHFWYNGRTHTAKKEHCHRVLGKHGKEKWEVLPEFRYLYAWCRGDQDEKKNA